MNVAKRANAHKASDLRAEVARQRIPIYQLAARIGMHPGRLGMILNERLPLSRDLAERLAQALGGAT